VTWDLGLGTPCEPTLIRGHETDQDCFCYVHSEYSFHKEINTKVLKFLRTLELTKYFFLAIVLLLEWG
jgi:hypothetical protein